MLKFDFSDFERAAKDMNGLASQVPFALANAMNTAAFETRRSLITQTWPEAIKSRNKAFLGAALRVERATKRTITVAVSETGPAGGRANLLAHAEGALKIPRGRRLAIPSSGSVRRGAHGIPKGQKPRGIIASTPKRALRITPKGIFIGEGGRLRLKYTFEPSARITKDVPFYDAWERFMRVGVKRAFGPAMVKAMASRKRYD